MSADYCIDASAIIAAWDKDYPKDVFPSLWPQLAKHRTDIVLIEPIYDEIKPMTNPLRVWMTDNDFESIPIDGRVEELSLRLEKEYQIREGSEGASRNDIKLIAYAKINNKIVVTDEEEQPQKPVKKYKYKIPAICDEKKVECINFIKMIRQLEIRI